jgi:hypothetical protein
VNDFTTLSQMALVLVVTVIPVVALARYADRAEDHRAAQAWPQGVQEEDPQPWKLAPSAA